LFRREPTIVLRGMNQSKLWDLGGSKLLRLRVEIATALHSVEMAVSFPGVWVLEEDLVLDTTVLCSIQLKFRDYRKRNVSGLVLDFTILWLCWKMVNCMLGEVGMAGNWGQAWQSLLHCQESQTLRLKSAGGS
jgi:hypothetical protein